MMTSSGRPLVNYSIAVNHALGSFNVFGYHVFNVAVHAAATLLFYLTLRRTLSAVRSFAGHATTLAFAVALIFAVHPLQTAAVSYVIQRAESMCAIFVLATLYASCRALQTSSPWMWQVLAVLACMLGMLCKEVMAVVPLLVLLYQWVFSSMSFRDLIRTQWALYLGLSLSWIVLFLVAYGARRESAGFGFESMTPWGYVKIQCDVLWQYFGKCFWPKPLYFDIGWVSPPALSAVAWKAALLLFSFVLSVLLALRRSAAGFAGLWVFLLLAPSSSIVPVASEMYAEQRMYLPLAGIVSLVVVGVASLVSRPIHCLGRKTSIAAFGLGCVLIALAAASLALQTWNRNRVYETRVSLWTNVVESRPDNPRGHYNLGVAVEEDGRLEEAMRHYSKAVSLFPRYAKAHNQLGILFGKSGDYDRALHHLETASSVDPSLFEAWNNLGNLYFSRKEPLQAARHYETSLALDPGQPATHFNLGLCLENLQRLEEARVHFAEALRLDPGFEPARRKLSRSGS